MGEQRIRVMVGEGQTSRKGLLRFVLENEGYDVIAEASSTLELAQRLVIHRPDVVVLDDGIDASAVGMMREVLPSAKVILVWPRGVAAVGVEARLEPSEVMTSLGSTVARAMGRGPVMAPPRHRVAPPDVIVVPEPETEPETGNAGGSVEAPRQETAPTPAADAGETTIEPAPAGPAADVMEEVTGVVETEERTPPAPSQALPHVMMRPGDIATPTWTYTAPGVKAPRDMPNRLPIILLSVLAGVLAIILAIVLASTLTNPSAVGTTILSGSVGDYVLPGTNENPDIITDVPGTYEGVVHVRADGSITLQASGAIRLRVDGLARVVASGDVKVSGEGVVHNVSASTVRVRGNGTMRITITDGSIRLRLQGSVTSQGDGVVRVGGIGRFLITHRPV